MVLFLSLFFVVFHGDTVGCFNVFIVVSTLLSCFSVSRFAIFVCVVPLLSFTTAKTTLGERNLLVLLQSCCTSAVYLCIWKLCL